jgi:hypothetical protein
MALKLISLLVAALGTGAVALDSAAPQQISLSYGASPETMVVTWASLQGGAAEVRYGPSADSLTRTARVQEGLTYSIDDYTSPWLYNATLTELVAGNNIYYYAVGSEAQGYSDVYSFKTHPGVGVAGVTIHVVGDLGQTSNTLDTLEEMLAAERALAGRSLSGGILSMGDLSYANGDQALWDAFGAFRQFLAAEVPMLTTLGNHEYIDDRTHAFTAYTARFSNPPLASGKRELYYSYDMGLAHVVMVAGYCTEMRTEYARSNPCLANGTAQMDWLVADLAAVDKAVTPWTFVIFHEPYVNSNKKHNIRLEGAPMQEAIEDTLHRAGVDLVLTGHVHAYERSCRVYQYVCQADAPYYITIGDGGNKEGLADQWVDPQPDWSAFRQASYGYGELNVLNSTHTLWQWHQNQDLQPTVADQFWVVKGEEGPSHSLTGTKREGVTQSPRFADNARGKASSVSNAERRAQWEQEQKASKKA